MTPHELRIGNWIFDCEQYVQVEQITTDKCFTTYGWSIWEDIQGISITPEILKKCRGVVKHGYVMYGPINGLLYEIMGIPVFLPDGGGAKIYIILTGKNNKLYHIEVDVPYTHALQNKIFALTGQDLEITL